MAGSGDWNDTKAATEETQEICDQVKGQVEKKTEKNYGEFKAVEYSVQTVAGTNYVIKVQVGAEEYIQLTLLQEIPRKGGKVFLHGVKNTTKDAPLILP